MKKPKRLFKMIRDNIKETISLTYEGQEFCVMSFPEWTYLIAHPEVIDPPEAIPEPEEDYLLGTA